MGSDVNATFCLIRTVRLTAISISRLAQVAAGFGPIITSFQ